MREVLTCVCGCQSWTIYGATAVCNECGLETKLVFGSNHDDDDSLFIDVSVMNKRFAKKRRQADAELRKRARA